MGFSELPVHPQKGCLKMAVVVKTVLGSHFGVGGFTTHFRTYFSGDWDVHWGYGILTHGRMMRHPKTIAKQTGFHLGFTFKSQGDTSKKTHPYLSMVGFVTDGGRRKEEPALPHFQGRSDSVSGFLAIFTIPPIFLGGSLRLPVKRKTTNSKEQHLPFFFPASFLQRLGLPGDPVPNFWAQ